MVLYEFLKLIIEIKILVKLNIDAKPHINGKNKSIYYEKSIKYAFLMHYLIQKFMKIIIKITDSHKNLLDGAAISIQPP